MSKSKDPRRLEGQKDWLPKRNPLHNHSPSVRLTQMREEAVQELGIRAPSRVGKGIPRRYQIGVAGSTRLTDHRTLHSNFL